MGSRVFLFLQGPHGPFFRQLARALTAEGHRVLQVALNGGDDSLTGGAATPLAYRGGAAHFQSWASAVLERHGVTDVLLYGDCRFYHQQVIALKARFQFRVWVLEEGYLRPSWITLEQDGVNAHSSVPARFQAWVSRANEQGFEPPVPEHSKPVGRVLRGLVFWCHIYYLKRFFGAFFYPWYRSHRPVSYLREAWSWLCKLTVRRLGRSRSSDRTYQALMASPTPFFLVPLQLDADAQIRHHSNYRDMREFLADVLDSFARRAPQDARLVVKAHPLDSEVVNYRRIVARLATRLGLESRVVFLEGGEIPALLKRALGLVTVNSTVGLQAIHHGCPTKVMGRAIYDHPALTAQCSLDAFWQARPAPDHACYRLFRSFLLEDCQINGNFYSIRGRRLLVPQVVKRLLRYEPAPVDQPTPKVYPQVVSWIGGPPEPLNLDYVMDRRRPASQR